MWGKKIDQMLQKNKGGGIKQKDPRTRQRKKKFKHES
jgi:hypothetical protein